MTSAIGDYETLMSQALDFYSDLASQNIDQYTSMYQSTISDYSQSLDQAFGDLMSGFAEQRELVGQGFEFSRQALQQGIQQQVASTTAQQAFTGLGNTSFGQANIGAIQRQGALDLGLLGEREQMTMADLIGQQTQAAFGA
ncbi:MAG: hypothetical protein VYC81_07305, partial [Actinomycetota bacterium]|nr:hypothetical protein [Actinomycetota bacterium]